MADVEVERSRADAGQSYGDALLRDAAGDIEDLLALGAMAFGAPGAFVAVRRTSGDWAVASFGLAGVPVASLAERLADDFEPVELGDLPRDLPGGALVGSPFALSWALGVSVPIPGVQAVFAVVDLAARRASAREIRALRACVGRLAARLAAGRSIPALAAGSSSTSAPVAPSASQPDSARSRSDRRAPDASRLLRSSQVADIFDVTERTVLNWANSGRLRSTRTMGGHLRFHPDDVMGLLAS